MCDYMNQEIHIDDSIVFIVNERGKAPQLMAGSVKEIHNKSINAWGIDGENYRVLSSARPGEDGIMRNTIKLTSLPLRKEGITDYTGVPIQLGDKAAFMEAPSQSYCTSFVLGTIIKATEQEVILRSDFPTATKYMRKPKQILVVSLQEY